MKAVSKFSLLFLSALLLASTAPVRAQVAVYDFYTSDIVLSTFQLIDGNNETIIDNNDFVTPLSHYQGFPATDYDNGVAFGVHLPFPFVFNGIEYQDVNIAVNGWVNFGTQVPLGTNDPQNLFGVNLPNATIAPYFGDHYLRPDATQGFSPSKISWNVEGNPGQRVFTVQWEDLNINYLTAQDPKQSIATFQLKLFEFSTLQTGRGNIEFHYGNIGSGLVQTRGATLGIEDESGLSFMNGLFVTSSDPLDSVRHSFRRSVNWPPSRQPGRVIQFVPFGFIVDNWGDGDADLSQPVTPIVEIIDPLTILRSRAFGIQLDSVFGRAAFHADVNHNGRYTIDQQTSIRINDTTRISGSPQTGHPSTVVYFDATAFDAAYILLYLAGKLPTLPWILDTIPPFGKLPGSVPTALAFGTTPSELNDRFVAVPITMQGVGALSAEFSLAYDHSALRLVSVTAVDTAMHFMSSGDRVVIAGAGEFGQPSMIGTARFERIASSTVNTVGTANLTVNDQLAKNVTVTVGAPGTNELLGAYPDPFYTRDGATQIFYNTKTDGMVTLKIYDVLGNLVRTLVSADQSHGSYTVVFDGRDSFSKELTSGTYFYRLDADGASTTKQLVIYNGVK